MTKGKNSKKRDTKMPGKSVKEKKQAKKDKKAKKESPNTIMSWVFPAA